LADLDAVVLHGAAVGEAGDRLVEHDHVVAVVAVPPVLAGPEREQQRRRGHRQHEGTDQDVVGARFHGVSSVSPAPLQERILCATGARPLNGRTPLLRGRPIAHALRSYRVAGGGRAARARGPWKYWCTQGWSKRSTSARVPVVSTRPSPSAATRSQIA